MKTINNLKTLLKKIVVLIMMFTSGLHAKDIYVAKNGNDNNPGTLEKPYLTISKAASVAVAGDVVFIREGTYEETLSPQNSGTAGNPIVFQSFPGEKVIISAMQALSGWTKDSGSIYKTRITFNSLGDKDFVMNGATALNLARWPNKTNPDPFAVEVKNNTGGSGPNVINGAYLTEPSIPNINWSGGTVWFYGGGGWLAWKRTITSSSAGRVNFTLNTQSGGTWVRTAHAPSSRGEFYLEGVKKALDYQNEWYYDKNTKELFVQLPGGKSPVDGQVKMRRRTETINLKDKKYIEIRNLAVFGGSINMEDSSTWQANGNNRTTNNLLYGVSSFYGNNVRGLTIGARTNAANISLQGSNNTIQKCEIAFNSGAGLKARGKNLKIVDNYIHDCNFLGYYDAPLEVRGIKNSLVKNNTVFNGGRDCIQYNGSDNEFSYNDVSQSNKVAQDCALFYTVGPQYTTEIHHNWFHDTEARGSRYKAAGIYLDNDGSGFKVHHNVVWNTEWSSIQINWNGEDIDVFNNTLWDGSKVMDAWHKEGTAFARVRVWNNLGSNGEWEPQSDKQNNLVVNASVFENASNGNFYLKNGSSPIDKGRIIAGTTDGFTGAKPDVGAYEYGGARWVAGITWNPAQGASGNGCYGLPGESCSNSNIEDTVEFVNAPTTISAKTSYDFEIKYSAKAKRNIIVGFWSSTGWVAGNTVEVEPGSGTVNVTINLPNAPTPGIGYIYKTHIRPLNTSWQDALDADQINNVTVQPAYVDKISFKDPSTTIVQATSYSFDVDYEASADREVVVEFWSSTNWLGQQNVVVSKGSGTQKINVNLANLPAVGTGYIYKVHIRPLNTTWRDALDRDQINGVTVNSLSTQIIADGTYLITSPINNQRLLSRALESHSAVMTNPGNYDDQKWVFTHLGDDVYTIKNKGTNRYLEVPYAACTNGTNVATWTDATNSHKQWKVVANGSGIYGLKPMHCLSTGLDRAAGAPNANVQIWGYSASNANQKWKIEPDNQLSKATITREVASLDENFTIYPNPVTEMLYINTDLKDVDIQVYDMLGKAVLSRVLYSENNDTMIDVLNLEEGLYFISIDGSQPVKFYKK